MNTVARQFSLKTLSRKVSWFFRRFHLIIYFVIVSTGFGVAVISFNTMIENTASTDGYVSDIHAGSIDSATLQRVNQLKQSKEVTSLPGLSGEQRNNPFSE